MRGIDDDRRGRSERRRLLRATRTGTRSSVTARCRRRSASSGRLPPHDASDGDYKSLQAGHLRRSTSSASTRPAAQRRREPPPRPAAHRDRQEEQGGAQASWSSDLKRITAKLAEDIPALIIDDESDQASINTSNPEKWEQGRTERTAIKRPDLAAAAAAPARASTSATQRRRSPTSSSIPATRSTSSRATSSSRSTVPPGYMGARDFHDLDRFPDDEVPTVATPTSWRSCGRRRRRREPRRAHARRSTPSFSPARSSCIARAGAAARSLQASHDARPRIGQAGRPPRPRRRDSATSGARAVVLRSRRAEAARGAVRSRRHRQVMEARADGEPVPASFVRRQAVHRRGRSTRIEGSANDPVLHRQRRQGRRQGRRRLRTRAPSGGSSSVAPSSRAASPSRV